MSTYTEAWHNTPPAVRDFYRNFALRYTDQRYPDFDFGPVWMPRSAPPFSAFRNWSHQTAEHGSFNTAVVHWVSNEMGDSPDPTIPYDIHGFYVYVDQYEWIPDWAEDYPRDKVTARQHYWTGAPRRRKNL